MPDLGMLTIPYIYYVFAVLKGQGEKPQSCGFLGGIYCFAALLYGEQVEQPLNPGRPFVAVLIMLVAAMAYFFINISASVKFRSRQSSYKSNSCTPDSVFHNSQCDEKPDYIIGNKAPLQTIPGE